MSVNFLGILPIFARDLVRESIILSEDISQYLGCIIKSSFGCESIKFCSALQMNDYVLDHLIYHYDAYDHYYALVQY